MSGQGINMRAELHYGPDMADPCETRYWLSAKMIPLGYSVSFDHEPTADEAQKAWEEINLGVRKELLKRLCISE